MESRIATAPAGDLGSSTLYRILRLRVEVFAVEQSCVYNDLDGRDLEPETILLWVDLDPSAPTVSAAARLLTDGPGRRTLGRIVTVAGQRHRGLAGSLITRGLELAGPSARVDLHAQSHLEAWYATHEIGRAHV